VGEKRKRMGEEAGRWSYDGGLFEKLCFYGGEIEGCGTLVFPF
jgi:hypothetical protein